jgi:tRNA/rRNA methyltransferase
MTNKPIIILVNPQMGENIGATARAMKNFGLEELRLVSPRDGWPNHKAEITSVGAIDIIKSAQIFDDLASAVQNLDYLYATTAQKRDMNKNYVMSKNIKSHYQNNLKTGIMFGRENWGLMNHEIALANTIITIDTTSFSSLNISQAVVVVAYELFGAPERIDLSNEQDIATKEELANLVNRMFKELELRGFFKESGIRPYMEQNITNIFSRIDKLSKNETKTLHGIISALIREPRH